jgi:hypothetical protein
MHNELKIKKNKKKIKKIFLKKNKKKFFLNLGKIMGKVGRVFFFAGRVEIMGKVDGFLEGLWSH